MLRRLLCRLLGHKTMYKNYDDSEDISLNKTWLRSGHCLRCGKVLMSELTYEVDSTNREITGFSTIRLLINGEYSGSLWGNVQPTGSGVIYIWFKGCLIGILDTKNKNDVPNTGWQSYKYKNDKGVL